MGLAHSLRVAVSQFGAPHDDYHDYDDDEAFAGPAEPGHDADALRHAPLSGERAARPLSVVRPVHLGFSYVAPQDFDGARKIADRLRAGGPVIVDLRDCGPELSKRLIDFCSGLAYALEGRLQDIGETVVLLVPHNVELSSDAPGSLRERRFHNQI